MPENQGSGTGSSEGEDLFEDLDKFFAPIQDVDWPDTSEPAGPSASPGEPIGSSGGEDTAAFEAPLGAEEDELPTGAEPMPGQERLLAEDDRSSSTDDDVTVTWDDPGEGGGATPTTSVATGSSDPSSGEEGTGFLFGEEDDDDLVDDAAITEEAFAQAPDAYVGLPQAQDEDDDGVAELMEDDVVIDEPPPDLEAVEAAADHFAASVRDEVRIDEESAMTGRSTEEVEIAALLGDDTDEEEPAGAEPARTLRVGPEGLGGPSWQEPTAHEVGAEPERRGPGRDMPMAFLTGLVLAGIALGAIALGAGPFAIFAGAVVLFAQGEFYFALQKRHYQPATALGLVAGALVLAAGYYRGESAMLAMVALGTFASFLWFMTVPVAHRRNVVSNIALTVLGIVYIPMLAAYAFALLGFPDGRGLVLAIIGLTIAYDIAAFGVGYFWGSRPLAPNVSPKKSWEGAIGATLVVIALAVGAVASAVDLLDTVGRAVGLAVVVAIFAPLGDLAESILKRDLGLKDMSSVLPGHGGVLDRIDAMLFVAPAAFMFLRLILL